MRTAALIVLYLALPAFGTYLTFRPTFDSGFTRIQTERGDGMLNHYLLENSWLALTDSNYRGSLLSPPMFFPTKWTIYYSENLFGAAPLYWVLRPVLPYDLAYIWWQILLNLLNFVAFVLVARWLKWPHLIALGGAFMWAFAMVHADQIKHQQMIGRLWMPLAAYYAIILVSQPSAKSLNRVLGCTFLQCLICIYSGWFLAVGLATFIPVLVMLRPGAAGELKRFAFANKRKVIAIIAFWTLAMAALFVPYLVVNWGVSRTFDETYHLTPTPSAWITGPPKSMWSETTEPIREPVSLELWLFCGFTIYALMLASAVSLFCYRRESRPEWWPVVAAAMFTVVLWMLFTLTLEDRGESLWRIVRFIPGGQAIRCVSRVYLIVYLFGLIAGLTWFAHVTARIQREGLRFAVQAVVMGCMIFEQTQYEPPSFARQDFYPLVDANAAELRGAEVGWVVPRYVDSTGHVSAGPYGEVFAMWVGLRANVPVLNGYSGRAPKGFPPMGALSNEQIRDWLKGKFRGRVRVIDSEAPADVKYPDVVVE